MSYSRNFSTENINIGSKVRRKLDADNFEYFVVGNYFPNLGWELKPDNRDLFRTQGILLYISPSDLKSEFELYK